MQLMANAVRHTHDGDLVAAGSAVRDGQVVLWVRDSGPGSPARTASASSSGSSGSRASPVRAPAWACRSSGRSPRRTTAGRFVMDAPGGGAQFVLTFPFVFEEAA